MNKINVNDAIFLIIDVQEKLVKMLEDDSVLPNAVKLSKTANLLDIPTVITEQYPKGLGSTVDEIKNSSLNSDYFEKTAFSALKEISIKEKLLSLNKKQVILFGIETHICVLQTAIDLVTLGFEVFVVQCACGSRNSVNKNIALERLSKFNNVQIVTSEMVIFELLETSKHPKFKEVQALIK